MENKSPKFPSKEFFEEFYKNPSNKISKESYQKESTIPMKSNDDLSMIRFFLNERNKFIR